MRKVDLFLGGALGLWVLDNVDPQTVGRVHTEDDAIKRKAVGAGMFPAECPVYGNSATEGLSVHYPRLLKPHEINNYRRIYNIHPGYLPWGRCYYPVFWALWADEPAGCTLHEIDAGIDTGPVVERCWVPKYDWDTGGTLHQRVSDAEKGLFLKYWPIIAGGVPLMALPQGGDGSFHLKQEFFDLKLYGAQGLTAPEMLKLIRCLSHPDYTGLIVHAGHKEYEVSARLVQ